MSCGNRFECALRKKSRFSNQSDKPSNLELYNENQKRLNELMRAREEIDNHFFKPIPTTELGTKSVDHLLQESNTNDKEMYNTSNTIFTPWVVPSATKK